MPHRQRLKNLITLEGIKSQATFCNETGYSPANLSYYLTGKTEYPPGELILKTSKRFPHWNLQYWFFEEGKPMGEEVEVIEKDDLAAYKKKIDVAFDKLMEVDKIKEQVEQILKNNPDLL